MLGKATCYGLEDRGSNSEGIGCEFSATVQAVLEHTQLPVQWVSDLFPAVKRPGRVIDQPSKSSTKLHLC